MPSNGRTILHVDDDPQILRQVHKYLTARDYDVASLSDPRKVIESLLETQCRVVLLDINMPHNGLDVLQEIKRHDGGIQVVFLTELVSMSTVMQSMCLGAEACLFKPLTDFAPLESALDAAFAKIDRWWSSLHDLTERKRQNTATVS